MEKTKAKKILKVILKIFCIFGIFLAFCAFFSASWYIKTFGKVGFSSILFTLFSNMKGTASGIVFNYLLKGLLPSVVCAAITSLIVFYRGEKIRFTFKNPEKDKKVQIYPFASWVKAVVSVVLCICLWISAVNFVELPRWAVNAVTKTKLYETEYIDPKNVKITFPKEKKNLVYIYVESLETTFISEEKGGGVKDNLIPELYALAEENVNFSNNKDVGGWPVVTDTVWTVASMVSQTSGVPFSGGIEGNAAATVNKEFLPGVTSINDILKKNGYYQTLMVGSDASFGGRDKYFRTHGIDKIYDINTARSEGVVPPNYDVWWGMEDKHLFRYAKQELLKISKGDKPFNFTMLTVDSHHPEGYTCDICPKTHDEKYENVLSCTSKQVGDFVEWIQGQDFYEDTVIVIAGDHMSMNNTYFAENMNPDFERHIYNCFINSSIETKYSKNRLLTPFDMFPTTLAAMGCEIKGERLGFGTNLFSGKKTVAERMGMEKFNHELSKYSEYYISTFL